jgi:hypothetical protein
MTRFNKVEAFFKIAKSVKKPSKSIMKTMSKDIYDMVLNNIEFANSDEDKAEAYKLWEGHIGLNIGWAKNRIDSARDIILKAKDSELSKDDKQELKSLIDEAVEALYYSLPIPLTHHKREELSMFKDMNYEKACKCGQTKDEDWYDKNCK